VDHLPPRASIGSVRERVEAMLVRAIAFGLRALPRSAVPLLGSAAGALYAQVDRRRFRVALDNLRESFGPGMPPRHRASVARAVFRHFGRVAFEILTLDRYAETDAGALVTYEGLEHIQSAYARGRGVFLFSAHYGNWELVALMQGYLHLPLVMITRPLDNPLLEEFVRSRRESSGNRVVLKRNAIRQALRAISEGKGVAIVIDQNVRSGARVFTEFFGRPAATTPTLALLALKTGSPIVPVFSFPGPRGRYRITNGRQLICSPTGDRDRDVRRITEQCTRLIEEQVRDRPGIWLWMHERWKSRPRASEWPPRV